jgi:hypothetical protein
MSMADKARVKIPPGPELLAALVYPRIVYTDVDAFICER